MEGEDPETPAVGVRKLGLGPLGWGLLSLFCNLFLLPSLFAWISGFSTLGDLRKAPAEHRVPGARAEAWTGIVLGAVVPLALTVGVAWAVVAGPAWLDEDETLFGEDADAGQVESSEEPEPEVAAEPNQVLILPSEHPQGASLPFAIWLHGYGSGPDLVYESFFQRLADGRGVAVLGVSAPLVYHDEEGQPTEGQYRWAEDPARDAARVTDALAAVAESAAPQPGRVVLFGFSQGGAVAAELAARAPERYAGAILLSPGLLGGWSLDQLAGQPARGQRYVISVGAGEDDAEVAVDFAKRLTALGGEVRRRAVPGQDEHRFPDDLYERLGGWLDHVLGPRGGLPQLMPEARLIEAELDRQLSLWIAQGYASPKEMQSTAVEWIGGNAVGGIEQMAERRLEALLSARRAEEAGWPRVTDCDRLDRAFAALERSGIVARQHFEDCHSCALDAIDSELESASEGVDPPRGYVFFHMQDTEYAAEGRGLYLSFGAADGEAEATAEVGRQIVKALRKAGLSSEWDGDIENRILVELDWQRRRF